MHNRRPEPRLEITNVEEALAHQARFRMPRFVIVRKQKHYWQIREKIFETEGRSLK